MALPPHNEGIANPLGSNWDIEDCDPQRLGPSHVEETPLNARGSL